MNSGYMLTARYPGRCTCGVEVEAGDTIHWDGECICGCDDCDHTGKSKRIADMSCVRGGGRGLAAALRRRAAKEARRRAKDGGR